MLLIPVSRFPAKTEYVEPVKYAIFSSVALSWFIKKAVSAEKNKWQHLKDNPFNLFFILFILLMSINLLYSFDKKASLRGIFTHITGFVYLYIFLDMLRKKEFLKKTISVFFLAAVSVSLVAVLQYIIVQFKVFTGLGWFVLPTVHRQLLLSGKTELMKLGGYRSLGTFEHPNLLGIYLAMALSLSIGFLFYIKSNIKRIVLFFVSLILLAGIFCSGSRGAFVSLLFSGSFLFVLYRKRIPKNLILVFLIFSLLAIVVFSIQINTYFRLTSGISNRNLIWQNSLDIFKEHPFVGSGLGNFSELYLARFGLPSIYDLENALEEISLTGSAKLLTGFTAHNLFLNYASEMGILSLFLILFFYAVYFGKFIKFLKNGSKNYGLYYAVALGCTAIILGDFIHSLFEASIGFNHLATTIPLAFFLSMGIVSMDMNNEAVYILPGFFYACAEK